MGTESSFLEWENHSWPNNSDNYSSGGGATAIGGDDDQEEKSAGKKKTAALNSDGGCGGLKAGAVVGKELGLVPRSTNNKKRSRGGKGVCNKNGKKSTSITTGEQIVKEGKGGGGGSGSGGGESDHEIHIWTERERRKKMRNMFANLHALLPQLPPKVYI